MTTAVPTATDEALMRRFQEGDEKAYEELVRRFKGPLLNFVYRIVNNGTVAEDLLQETFLRLWLNRDSYREIAKFSTWIYTVAGNLAKTELRKQKLRRWIPLTSGGRSGDEPALDPADESADPLHDLERRTINRRTNEEITKLPLVFREAVVLRDLLELPYEEISSILGIPLGTVKSRVSRGRVRLQKKLKDLL